MTIPVERWEACGNVYLLIDAALLPRPLGPGEARALCDPVDGLGGDGVIEIHAGDGSADARIRILNPDGSTSEACGNGTRMVARWASERSGRLHVDVATEAGVLACEVDGEQVAARMADAVLDGPQYLPEGPPFPHPHRYVGIGNPHVVIPVDDVGSFPLHEQGSALEHHPRFPERVNVEVVQPVGRQRVRMRVWERGVGETRACGTGACAVAVAAVLDGTATSPVTVETPGGELVVEVGGDRSVVLRGPARRVAVVDLPSAIEKALRR